MTKLTAREQRTEQLEQERRALTAQKQREQEAQAERAQATAQAIQQAGGLMGYVGRSAASSFGSAQAQNMALVLDALNGDPAARAAYEARNKEMQRPPSVHTRKESPADPMAAFKARLMQAVGVKTKELPTSFAQLEQVEQARLMQVELETLVGKFGALVDNVMVSPDVSDKAGAVGALVREFESLLPKARATKQHYARRNAKDMVRKELHKRGLTW